jgi:hypothetical protein
VGKTIRILENEFYEVVDDNIYPLNADIYMKDAGKYYVGYRSDSGSYRVYERNGFLTASTDEKRDAGVPLYRVDLYEDISGKYYPKIEDSYCRYLRRKDGKVERIEFTEEGSRGRVVEDQRGRLQQKEARKGER